MREKSMIFPLKRVRIFIKEFEEPTGIALDGFYQTMKAVQRINPSKRFNRFSC